MGSYGSCPRTGADGAGQRVDGWSSPCPGLTCVPPYRSGSSRNRAPQRSAHTRQASAHSRQCGCSACFAHSAAHSAAVRAQASSWARHTRGSKSFPRASKLAVHEQMSAQSRSSRMHRRNGKISCSPRQPSAHARQARAHAAAASMHPACVRGSTRSRALVPLAVSVIPRVLARPVPAREPTPPPAEPPRSERGRPNRPNEATCHAGVPRRPRGRRNRRERAPSSRRRWVWTGWHGRCFL